MKKNNIILIILIFVFFFLLGVFFYSAIGEKANLEPKIPISTNTDPLNATYKIDGSPIPLKYGKYEEILTPDSTSKIKVDVFGEPIYADIDGDGDTDASLYLTYNAGGSGTFFYLVAAIYNDGIYTGTDAILLGDRISPQNINIQHGIIMANFAERKNDEPMSTRPSMGKTIYSYIKDGNLIQIFINDKNETLYFGNLVFGHESRTFTTCQGDEYWLVGTNEYMSYIKDLYEKIILEREPYTPVFVVISGGIVPAPEDGFGADFDYGFSPKEIIKTSLTYTCE